MRCRIPVSKMRLASAAFLLTSARVRPAGGTGHRSSANDAGASLSAHGVPV